MAEDLKFGGLPELPQDLRGDDDLALVPLHEGVGTLRIVLLPVKGAEKGSVRKAAHLLLTLYFRSPHFRHLFSAEASPLPNRQPLGSEVDTGRIGWSGLRYWQKRRVRLATFEDLHGFSIVEPSGNTPEVIAQICGSGGFYDI